MAFTSAGTHLMLLSCFDLQTFPHLCLSPTISGYRRWRAPTGWTTSGNASSEWGFHSVHPLHVQTQKSDWHERHPGVESGGPRRPERAQQSPKRGKELDWQGNGMSPNLWPIESAHRTHKAAPIPQRVQWICPVQPLWISGWKHVKNYLKKKKKKSCQPAKCSNILFGSLKKSRKILK